MDQAQRDKVLKQGFVSRRVSGNLDAIVIGSGIGGLSTAALLAKAGKSKKVLVLEQHDQAGLAVVIRLSTKVKCTFVDVCNLKVFYHVQDT